MAPGCWQRWVRRVPVGSGAASLRACSVHTRVSTGTSAAAIHSLSSANMWLACALWVPVAAGEQPGQEHGGC